MIYMFMVVKLHGHDTPIQMDGDRKNLYRWVVDHYDEIEYMDIDCGVNFWAWLPSCGWLQYTKTRYEYDNGVRIHRGRPRVRGNHPECLHPWRFTFMQDGELTLNPMWPVTPLF